MKCNVSPELCAIGIRLGTCKASSADIERAFSTLSLVFGDRRHKLGSKKASRLAFVSRMLNKQSMQEDFSESEDLSEVEEN